ncbi:MAG TPA: T9SS type A sorting domain-containing protein [Bacteroidia bacterium]|nr:T9SS type A sorting domain-containing protein [Bacteroidia bacterium]
MKKLLLLFALVVISFASRAQVKFQDLYGDINLDDAQAVARTFDNGYILVGGTGPNVIDSTDIALFRLNSDGDLIWSSRVEGYKDDFISDVKQLSDGSFLLIGSTYSSPIDTQYADILVTKIDDSGFVVWSKVFGGSDYDEAQTLLDMGNDEFVILGNTWSYGSALKSALAIKIDASGNQIWANVSSTTVSNYFYGGDKTDEGFIAAGGTYNVSGGTNFDHYITKFDSSGHILWSKRYGTISADWAYAIRKTSDGGYIVAGVSTVNTAGGTDLNIFKLDSSGTVSWNYNYGSLQYERPSSIVETSSGNFVVAGFTNIGDSVNIINQDLLMEIDANGTIIWAHTFGDITATSECNSMISTGDGYALAGYTIGFQTGNIGDAYFVKTDTAGFSDCYEANFPVIKTTNTFTDSTGASEQMITLNESNIGLNTTLQVNQFGQICFTNATSEIQNANRFSLYPNPAQEYLTVRFDENQNSTLLSIKDITGRVLQKESLQNQNEVKLQLKNFTPGIYLLSVENGQTVRSSRFIRQ